MSAPKHINLLLREGFEYTTAGRALAWALNVGRIIVVATELVVILAFISRFWLDRAFNDLDRKIQQQVAFVKASSSAEQQFRSAQARLATFTFAKQHYPDAATTLTNIFSAVPESVSLSQVTVGQEQAQITGIALSEGSLATFLSQLESAKLGDVQLTDASSTSGQEIGVHFTIVINFPNKQ